MAEEKNNVCMFRGIRRWVMRRTFEKLGAKDFTTDEFSKTLRETWQEAKKEQARVCG